ncbi:acid-sensing ion channel 4-A-like [Dermacentor silvarum]|uniref:acid-sensing ion channel 4-A-like n=1 Tax=Dermacentor silvarum TaxID=543639 RepID=UPI002100E45D|nr:acid-sensing ion channel 4-A-like [Dermacentor silvarum]
MAAAGVAAAGGRRGRGRRPAWPTLAAAGVANARSSSALRRSSVPGLRLVASPAPLPRLRRVTWLLVWLSLGALLTQDLSAVVTDYLRFDDIVTVSVHEPARPSFPAVTVCNVNRVRRSALCDHHRRPLHALDPALLRWRRLLCNSTTYPNIALSKEDLELQRELAEWTRTVFRNTRYADLHLGHQVDNMLQHCAFNGQDCRAIEYTPLMAALLPAHATAATHLLAGTKGH